MSGCRIGRVKMKNGGADLLIIDTPKKSEAYEAVQIMAEAVSDKTLFAMYAVVDNDRVSHVGFHTAIPCNTYELLGAVELLKAHIVKVRSQ